MYGGCCRPAGGLGSSNRQNVRYPQPVGPHLHAHRYKGNKATSIQQVRKAALEITVIEFSQVPLKQPSIDILAVGSPGR